VFNSHNDCGQVVHILHDVSAMNLYTLAK